MDRRHFLASSSTAAASALAGLAVPQASFAAKTKRQFQLKYAPHLGMFTSIVGDDPIDQLNFMADQGFTAFEDNGMKDRDLSVQEAMANTMSQRGITMGVFVAHTIFWSEPNLTSGREDWRDQFLTEIRESVEVAKRVGATWMTVVPGHVDLRKDMGYQTANVIESLRRASDILAPHGLVMVLEPLNPRDHPGLFLKKMSQAYSVCKAVDSPACKILDDLYHQQVTEGNLIPNIDACWDEIAYFQVGDNPGRKEPTTGEINYRNVFAHIHAKGFGGVVGMEHGNSMDGADGARRVIDAYTEVDSF